MDSEGNIKTMSVNDTESPAHTDPLKKPKKVLEAGKAVYVLTRNTPST